MTSPKTPTPQGISALLRKAGFERSVSRPRNQGSSSGFIVGKCYDDEGAVQVRHHFWSMGTPLDRYEEKLAAYAEAITAAGFAAERGWHRLIVRAKAEES